jgi:hypothetical protein
MRDVVTHPRKYKALEPLPKIVCFGKTVQFLPVDDPARFFEKPRKSAKKCSKVSPCMTILPAWLPNL